MDIDAQNLKCLAQHRRRIVQNAYRKSDSNKQYVFPTKIDTQQSDITDMLSLESNFSQVYNLHHQNNKNPFIEKIKDKKQQTKCTNSIHIFKPISNKQSKTTLQSYLSKQKSKRKYLSLTPNKNLKPSKAVKSQQKVVRIRLTCQQIQIKKNQQTISKFQQLKRVFDSCFQNEVKPLEQKKQANFWNRNQTHNEKVKQTFFKLQPNTTDSTKERASFKKTEMHSARNNVFVQPFY